MDIVIIFTKSSFDSKWNFFNFEIQTFLLKVLDTNILGMPHTQDIKLKFGWLIVVNFLNSKYSIKLFFDQNSLKIFLNHRTNFFWDLKRVLVDPVSILYYLKEIYLFKHQV